MPILKENIYGGPNIGTYSVLSNKFFLYPPKISTTLNKFVQDLQPAVDQIEMTINNSTVLGVYIVANSYGMIIPNLVRETEIETLKQHLPKTYTITALESEDNAYGNLILSNDKGAIVSPLLVDSKDIIEKTLKVPVQIFHFANSKLPGSCGLATNHGVVIHPMATEKEAEAIAAALKVDNVDVSTINCGNPFLRGGAVVNDTAGIFGRATTGPEIARIMEVLQLQ
jgi:translation initiation factor 6